METNPHVIVIMADQLRADALGPYTPNLNRLSAESTVFNRCYCASPLCVPARGSFFTGRWPNQTGSLINPWEKRDYKHGLVRRGIPNLYGLMENDWDSWHTGKQHLYTTEKFDCNPDARTHWRTLELGYGPFVKDRGVRKPGGGAFRGTMPELVSNRWTKKVTYSIPATGRYEPGYDTFYDGYITSTTIDAIRQRDRSKPLLLNAMFLAPHPPLDIPDPWYSLIQTSDVNLPKNVGVWAADQSPLQLYNLTGLLGTRYTREEWQEIWRVYLGLVALLDHSVGRIIDELKTQGIYDDSLIVFTSDHGEMLGSHMLWQKMCCYEESARVPLFIKTPIGRKSHPGAQIAGLTSHVDVMPTILDYCGLPVPRGVIGRSLRPTIEKGSGRGREHLFIQFDGNGALGNFSRCVVAGTQKLIVDMFKDEVYFELYDIARDPQEMHNLAFDKPGKVQPLLVRLREHMRRTGDHLHIPAGAYTAFRKGYGQFRKKP